MKTITILAFVAASILFTGCGKDTKKEAADTTAKITETAKDTSSDLEKAAAEAAATTKKVAEELAKAAKIKVEEAGEATKKAASDLAAAAKVKADEASEATKKAAEDLKVKAVETTAAATALAKEVISDNGAGESAYAKCAGCHGKEGKTKALGKSEIIAGQTAEDIEKKLSEYKAGTRDVVGMGTLMKAQLGSMSNEDIKAVSAYIAGM